MKGKYHFNNEFEPFPLLHGIYQVQYFHDKVNHSYSLYRGQKTELTKPSSTNINNDTLFADAVLSSVCKVINKPLNSVHQMVVSRWLMYTRWLLNSRHPPQVRRISCPGITRELRRVGCHKRCLTYYQGWTGCWIQNQLFWYSSLCQGVNFRPAEWWGKKTANPVFSQGRQFMSLQSLIKGTSLYESRSCAGV